MSLPTKEEIDKLLEEYRKASNPNSSSDSTKYNLKFAGFRNPDGSFSVPPNMVF